VRFCIYYSTGHDASWVPLSGPVTKNTFGCWHYTPVMPVSGHFISTRIKMHYFIIGQLVPDFLVFTVIGGSFSHYLVKIYLYGRMAVHVLVK
jgi:hypothetical protein